jgi:Na+-driven multidrug efflux pump
VYVANRDLVKRRATSRGVRASALGRSQCCESAACLRLAVTWLGVLDAVLVALATFPGPVLRIFTGDDQVIAQATETIHALRWAMPAGMISGALLRAYTAVSPNKLGNAISIGCAVLTIVIANTWPGAPLASVAAAMIASQCLRLGLLAALYRRLFRAAIRAPRRGALTAPCGPTTFDFLRFTFDDAPGGRGARRAWWQTWSARPTGPGTPRRHPA